MTRTPNEFRKDTKIKDLVTDELAKLVDDVVAGVLAQDASYPEGPVRRYAEYILGAGER